MQPHMMAGCSRRHPISGNKRVQAVDRHVARRMRERRLLVGLSGYEVAKRLGMPPQQVHRYERALNRITAGLLHQFARELAVDVGYFFKGLEESDSDEQGRPRTRTLELVRHFMSVRSVRQKEALVALSRAMAQQSAPNPMAADDASK